MSGTNSCEGLSKEIGKLLLLGYQLLKTSCGCCGYALIQDKQGKSFCVNCNQEMAAGARSLGPSQRYSHDAIEEAAAVAHHKREQQILRDVELNLLAEVRTAAAALKRLESDTYEPDYSTKDVHVRYIRECTSIITDIRNMIFN